MIKLLNLLFGICSLLSLIFTVVILYNTLNEINLLEGDQKVVLDNLATIYKTLGSSIVALIGVFLLQSYIFNTSISGLQKELGEMPLRNKHLSDVNKHLIGVINYHIRINRSTTSSIHNISHYHRYITLLLRDIVIDLRKEDSKIDKDKCRKVCNKFDTYLFSLLSTINSTVKVITKDECSTCIKLFKTDKVKTLYRDTDNYRNRRESDYRRNNKDIFVYDVSDNFAFNLIADPNAKETFFVCDNLKEFKGYHNRNSEWETLYNATIVVPIQANLSGDKRKHKMHILGFLCCDNMIGGFENQEIKDFLSATGDLLYNLLILFDRFYKLSNEKGFTNDTLRNYDHWGNS